MEGIPPVLRPFGAAHRPNLYLPGTNERRLFQVHVDGMYIGWVGVANLVLDAIFKVRRNVDNSLSVIKCRMIRMTLKGHVT